jgi:hypothetical protein
LQNRYESEQIKDHDAEKKSNAQLRRVYAWNFDDCWEHGLLSEYEMVKPNLWVPIPGGILSERIALLV